MLLKQKSKIIVQQKPRTKYQVKDVFKRAKIDPKATQVMIQQVENQIGLSGTGKTSKKIEA